MANGGIIGPINDPTLADITTTFTASGSYTSPGLGPLQADYLVVAGGGGGAGGGCGGGGGGAGGYRTSFPCGTKLTVPASPITVTVGAGGAINNSGTDSIFANSPSPITSTGGGRGGSSPPAGVAAGSGGSGGGGGGSNPTAGTGNSPPTSPSQGNSGGTSPVGRYAAGGGGGAGGSGNPGGPCAQNQGGNGGVGSTNSIIGSPISYAGGGGGMGYGVGSPTPTNSGTGGSGVGGNGALYNPGGRNATTGTVNTGGGGGGGSVSGGNGAAGGSGIVIIKQYSANRVAPGVWSIKDAYNYKKAGQWT